MTAPVYASFDLVPAPKGASVHIEAFSRALGRAFGPLDLVTIAPSAALEAEPSVERWPGVFHHRLPAYGDDLIERVLAFRTHLALWWGRRHVPFVHVRSIYEGYPIALRKERLCDRFIFEVNGLPSIELKYHYPKVARDAGLLRKLRAQERACIAAADLLVTPSPVTSDYLVSLGAPRERVRTIPNGVDLERFAYAAPSSMNGRVRMLYAGTMTRWQGLEHALEALKLIRKEREATLTLAGPARERRRQALLRWAAELKVDDAITFAGALPQADLARLHHEHDVVIAPLPRNDRNVVQGCCPLKVVEAMASGTPLVASDLPVVRALADDGAHALLVPPGSPKAIRDAVLRLADESGLAAGLSAAARARVEERHDWAHAGELLVEAYEEALYG